GLTGAQTSDLVEGHTCCHGGVEGLRVTDRDVHDLVAVLPHQTGQALALCTHDEHEWAGGQVEAGQGGCPAASSPTANRLSFLKNSRVRLRLVTCATGIRARVPAEVFHAVMFTPAERRSGMTTPCAPKAVADRMIAPRLCGSVTPSRTTMSAGVFDSRATSRRASGCQYWYGRVCRAMPWWTASG